MTANLPIFTNFNPNSEWAKLPLFDREGWKRVPFGAFADSINERVEPSDAAEEIYAGLEHLEPQNLHIRRWGKGSDVIGTKLRFRKGDIIFGRRRAYQRKLAVAEFDGICSAHAMVVRAKPDVVLPGFLPFLMMSDKFMNRAVDISVGSLSPTINWTTFKLEEFDLPPLDQQRRIAEILWAVDENEQLYMQLDCTIVSARESWLNGVFNGAKARKIRIRELGDIITGTTPKTAERDYYEPPLCLFVSPADISVMRYITTTEKRISHLGLETGRPIPKDSIMVVCIGSTIGKVAMASERCITNQQINTVICNAGHNPLAVFYALRHHQQLFRQAASCTAVPILNKGTFAALTINYFENGSEAITANQLIVFEEAENRNMEVLKALRELKIKLINTLNSDHKEVSE